MRQGSPESFFIERLTEVRVESAEEGLRLVEKGAAKRTTAETCRNQASSRSHSVFTLHLTSETPVEAMPMQVLGSSEMAWRW